MSYGSVAGLIARFGREELVQLTDRATPPAGRVDEAVAAQALADAAAVIDFHLGAREALPLADPPPVLGYFEAVLAREALHRDRPTDEVTAAAERVRATLLRLARGEIALSQATQAALGAPLTEYRPRDFGPDQLVGL